MDTTDDLRAAYERLQARFTALTGRTERMETHFRGLDGRLEADAQDVVSFNANDEVLEGLGDAARAEIAEIRSALQRIRRGTYGICEGCEDPIGEGRLAALPHARLCVDCAS